MQRFPNGAGYFDYEDVGLLLSDEELQILTKKAIDYETYIESEISKEYVDHTRNQESLSTIPI